MLRLQRTGASRRGNRPVGAVPGRDAVLLTTWQAYLEALWRSAGHTRADFVRATGINDSNVSRWLAGINTPSVANLRRIAKTYDIPQTEVFTAALMIDEHDAGSPLATLSALNEVPPAGAEIKVLVSGTVTSGPLPELRDDQGRLLLGGAQLAEAIAQGRAWKR